MGITGTSLENNGSLQKEQKRHILNQKGANHYSLVLCIFTEEKQHFSYSLRRAVSKKQKHFSLHYYLAHW